MRFVLAFMVRYRSPQALDADTRLGAASPCRVEITPSSCSACRRVHALEAYCPPADASADRLIAAASILLRLRSPTTPAQMSAAASRSDERRRGAEPRWPPRWRSRRRPPPRSRTLPDVCHPGWPGPLASLRDPQVSLRSRGAGGDARGRADGGGAVGASTGRRDGGREADEHQLKPATGPTAASQCRRRCSAATIAASARATGDCRLASCGELIGDRAARTVLLDLAGWERLRHSDMT